jgi:phosphatidylglycerophosphate synthase
MSLATALLLAAGYVMDSVDGQLARLSGAGSVAGEWLDHTIDCFKTSLVHVAVLVSWYRFPPVDSSSVLVVPLAYLVVQNVTYFGLILMPLLRAKVPSGARTSPATADHEHPLRRWVLLPTDYGVFVWSFALLAVPPVFLAVYSTLALVNVAALAWGLRKWWRELKHLDAMAR